MWIEVTNSATRALKIPEIDEKVEFSDNGKAQVSKQVGRALVREVDAVVEAGSSDDEQDDQESTDEEDED